ncbi:UPAR/Ly6 domain-containing protein [Caenorhabditis elegans]|uniref:UPAR/Ly6 domain-containing protein n=2 Tax=Caenorhabditis elegans TaxID=6239 RepID=B2D6N2_CAEEL|nr:UPAR/Ly6 domain-containing protein [Caenorhabditis elegans]CAQ35020.2 UPAR/Ly6 domain-containing protein [Caenorhabditis elegans]|eukprot:NP_001256478.1 LU (Ly6 Urokinase plasminogen) domain Receptor-related Protein [Caenorhabditis elegans]
MALTISILILVILNLKEINSVKCYHDNNDVINGTCEGDFCTIAKSTDNYAIYNQRACFIGIKKPSHTCTLDFSDNMVCFCDTDYCNTISLLRGNITILPVIQCKALIQTVYTAIPSNKCIRIISYIKHDRYELDKFNNDHVKDLQEFISGAERGDSGDLVIDAHIYWPEKMLRNFFSKGCYNTTMSPEHYYVYCRCEEANCNTPESEALPYPISPPVVKCHTSGFAYEMNYRKFETLELTGDLNYKQNYMTNETYVDEGIECQGHFCVIVPNKYIIDGEYVDIYYKGCISANEQGEQKLSVGQKYVNEITYYICNTDFCNIDIETSLDAAANASTISDNGADGTKFDCFQIVILFIIFLI